MGKIVSKLLPVYLIFLVLLIAATPETLKSDFTINTKSGKLVIVDSASLVNFIKIFNELRFDYFTDSPDSMSYHIDSARSIIDLNMGSVFDDLLYLMIGLLYVKSDSIDQAIAEYDKIDPNGMLEAHFLWQRIVSTPDGIMHYYPDIPSTEFSKIFSAITPLATQDLVDKKYYNYSSPIFGNTKLVGWGCIVDDEGDIITTCAKFYETDHALAGLFASVDLTDVLTKIIGDEYVMLSAKGYKQLVENVDSSLLPMMPAVLLPPDDIIGDTVIIIQNPYSKQHNICLGMVNTVVEDPLTEQVIEIQTYGELQHDMAIVVSLKGELIGMISTIRTRDEFVYAYPVNQLTKFRFKNRRSVPMFTDDLRHLSDAYTLDQEALNYMAAGKLNLWRGYIESALGMFEKARELGSHLAMPNLYLGFCNWKLENYEQAELDFVTAYEKDNELDDAYYNLGLMYVELGKMSEAKKAFKKANRINNKNAYTLYQLAKIYLAEGKKRDVKKIAHDLEWLDKNLAEELRKQI